MFCRFFVYPLFLLSFWFLLLLSKNTKIPKIFSLFLLFCFFALVCLKRKFQKDFSLFGLLCFCLVFLCLLVSKKNRKHQKYFLFFFGFVSSLQGSAIHSVF